MSGDALDSGGRQIIESILSDADAQALRLVENAESTASALRAKARKEGERTRDALLARATEQCGRIRAQGLATARIEAKRLLLAAREDLAGRFLEQIEEKLAATVRSSETYSQSLWNLAAEAVAAIGLPEVVLRISQADAGILGDGFAGRLVADGAVRAAGVSRIAPQFDENALGGGCIAQSPDGRIVFDNTYSKRMQRKRRELRAMIVRDVMNGHG